MDRGLFCTKNELVGLLQEIDAMWKFGLYLQGNNDNAIIRLPLSLDLYDLFCKYTFWDLKLFREATQQSGESSPVPDHLFLEMFPFLCNVYSDDSPLRLKLIPVERRGTTEFYYGFDHPDPTPIQLFLGGEVSDSMIVETRFRARKDEKTESLRKVVDMCLRKKFKKLAGSFVSITALEMYQSGGRLATHPKSLPIYDLMESDRHILVLESYAGTELFEELNLADAIVHLKKKCAM